MTQLLNRPELSPPADNLRQSYYWLGPTVTEAEGRIVREVYESGVDPLNLSVEERTCIRAVAKVIITSPQDKVKYSDAPEYMIHIPDPRSRQTIQRLQQIISDLNPLNKELQAPAE